MRGRYSLVQFLSLCLLQCHVWTPRDLLFMKLESHRTNHATNSVILLLCETLLRAQICVCLTHISQRMSTPHLKLHPGTMGILIALETASPVRDAGITPWCLRLRWRGTDRGSRVGLWMTRGSSLPTCDYLLLQISVPHPEGHPGIGPFCPHLTGRLLPPSEMRTACLCHSFSAAHTYTTPLHPTMLTVTD